MHYSPRLLNEYSMFTRLVSLPRAESTSAKIERFLYRASCVLNSLEAIKGAEGTAVMFARQYLQQIKLPANKRIAVSTDPLLHLYAHVPSALSASVLMQNQLLEIIKEIQELSISTPLSFRDAMEKKEGIKRFEFDDATIKALNDYWENTGKYIRDLRDVDEHFDALVDHTYFELKSDPGQILMFFPDNPECKSSKRFTYVRENDAYEIIANNLQEINRIIESICEAKGLPPQQHQASIMLSHMGDLTEEQERTLGLMMVVTKVDKTEKGNHVHLDTIETMQVIPDKEKGIGNIAFRKLKTDNEIEPQD